MRGAIAGAGAALAGTRVGTCAIGGRVRASPWAPGSALERLFPRFDDILAEAEL